MHDDCQDACAGQQTQTTTTMTTTTRNDAHPDTQGVSVKEF